MKHPPTQTKPQHCQTTLNLAYRKVQDLRYGENPHQLGALYQERTAAGSAGDQLLHGKALSFNNIVDADAAWRVVSDFDETTVAVIKHTNPCGLSSHPDQKEAYTRAFQGDTVSAYGGIVGFNSIVEESTAQAMRGVFYEVIIAPAYTPEALALLRRRRNLRVIQRDANVDNTLGYDLRPVTGGLLVQTPDAGREDTSTWKIVTERAPTEQGDARPGIRLEGRKARQVQRHRPRKGPGSNRHGSRPAQPRHQRIPRPPRRR